MRIATSQVYTASLKHMNKALSDVMELQMMTTTQKKLNAPSDDPSGAALSMQLRAYDATLTSYEENCTLGGNYLATADASLQQASETIMSISELAEQAATDTYNQAQMEAMGIEMAGYMDSMFQASNTKMGEMYLFGGNDIENSAYEQALGVTIDDPSMGQADVLAVEGEVESTVYIKATGTGVVGGATDIPYSYSVDGGKTWTDAVLAAGDTELTAGTCSVTLATGTALTEETGADDGTNLYVRPAYVYAGSSDPLSVAIGENSELEITSVGSSIFGGIDGATGEPYPDPNLFETMGDLVAYMDTGNADGVASCIEDLNAAYEQLLQETANIGARQNSAQNTATAISITKDRNISQISAVEDADATQLSVEMAQAEYVYEAVLSTTTNVFQLNLLNYL